MEAEGWHARSPTRTGWPRSTAGDDFIDLIFNSGNGLTPVNDRWFRDNAEAEVLGVPVRIANLEDSLLSKAFIMERERYDGADIAHLLQANAEQMDWAGLLDASGALARAARAPDAVRLHLPRRAAPHPALVDGDAARPPDRRTSAASRRGCPCLCRHPALALAVPA